MEAIAYFSSYEKPFSPSKHYARNFKKSTFSYENLAPMNYQNGILQTPPFLYNSFPPFLAHQQPPLLPLPISNGVQNCNYIHNLPLNRGLSCPPINRKVNKNGKKSKSFTSSPKKEKAKGTSVPPKVVMNLSLGPDPKDLPKDVPMVLSLSPKDKDKKEQSGVLSSSQIQNSKKYGTTSSFQERIVSPTDKTKQPSALRYNPVRNSRQNGTASSLLHGDIFKGGIVSPISKKEQCITRSSSSMQNSKTDEITSSLSHASTLKEDQLDALSIFDESRVETSRGIGNNNKVNKFSGSIVFTVSPPPSSLPLPTFSLRPKLSCKTEAAGVDAGATDNLRRLLRLR